MNTPELDKIVALHDQPRAELAALKKSHADLLAALQVLLDQVDYTAGACTLTEMVGAVLPKQVIAMCRTAIAAAKGNQS